MYSCEMKWCNHYKSYMFVIFFVVCVSWPNRAAKTRDCNHKHNWIEILHTIDQTFKPFEHLQMPSTQALLSKVWTVPCHDWSPWGFAFCPCKWRDPSEALRRINQVGFVDVLFMASTSPWRPVFVWTSWRSIPHWQFLAQNGQHNFYHKLQPLLQGACM